MASGFDSGEVAERSRVEQAVPIQLVLTISQFCPISTRLCLFQIGS
jgi:hypothetical protein